MQVNIMKCATRKASALKKSDVAVFYAMDWRMAL